MAKMQKRNPEWDFMSRTYFVLALANMALRDPGFPLETKENLQYQASNPVGDAVLLYAMVLGPLWDEVDKRGKQ